MSCLGECSSRNKDQEKLELKDLGVKKGMKLSLSNLKKNIRSN